MTDKIFINVGLAVAQRDFSQLVAVPNTCGNCKFRGREIEGMDDDFNLVMTGFFQCQRIRFDANSQPKKNEGAVVQDGSGYHGKLCVEADFGCVKWEGLETPAGST